MRRGGLWLVGLVLLAGCAAPDDPRPEQAGPPDRDEPAVLAALRQLDACALLNPAAAGVPGFPADLKPQPQGPHRCEIRPGQTRSGAVGATLGVLFDAERRFAMESVTVSGVKAYRQAQSGGCDVYLPVSFRRSILFHSEASSPPVASGQRCDAVTGFARGAATRLADPDRLRVGATRPMADWDPCQVLAGVLGDSKELIVGTYASPLGLDSCGADTPGPETPFPAVSLSFWYGSDRAGRGDVRTIEGRKVWAFESMASCSLTWSNGLVGSVDTVVEVVAPDCQRGEPIVRAAFFQLGGSPSPPVAPQRPLTYQANEPDVGVPGACVDYTFRSDPKVCQPYVDVPVPSGKMEILRAAVDDTNVYCAIAREAVARHFGAALRPVTTDFHRCAFVEPTHAIVVEVGGFTSTGWPWPASDGHPVAVSGHAGYANVSSGVHEVQHQWAVEATQGDERGVLIFGATFRRPRGADPQAPIDSARSAGLEPALADIVTAYLSG